MFYNGNTGGGVKWWEFLLNTKNLEKIVKYIRGREKGSQMNCLHQIIIIKYTFTIQNYT